MAAFVHTDLRRSDVVGAVCSALSRVGHVEVCAVLSIRKAVEVGTTSLHPQNSVVNAFISDVRLCLGV